jgi:hypothetical protein
VKLSDKQAQILDGIVRNLRITLKNTALYNSDHPIYQYSINNFKTALENWFTSSDKLDIGVAQDKLFYDGQPLKEDDEFYKEVANHLHVRGMLALSLLRGVDAGELTGLFNVLKNDRKEIRSKGGIQKNMPENRHIKISEIDYTVLLANMPGQQASEEVQVWQFLFEIAEQSKSGQLPDSKVEFLVDFFRDTKRSVQTLNKVYKDALSQMQDEKAAKEIRSAILQICQYLESHRETDSKDLKVKLMNVISQLHPDLIGILFDQTVGGDENFDLVESITKDFSEDYIAEFIESLISKEDSFNENLIKMFDKLAPGESRSNTVVSMVADKLFNKRIMNPETLSQLQMSIMEIFKRHPDSNFMNQIYKITVDAVMNKKIDTLVYMARLSPLINQFVQSMETEELNKEKIWLLLNILWLENDAAEFKKFKEKLLSALPNLVDSKDTGRLREIVEFFTEKTRPDQKKNKELIAEIQEALSRITNKEMMDGIISLIPNSTTKELDDIVYTLVQSQADCARYLVDAFIAEKNPAHRNKYWFVITRMKSQISKEVVNRLEYAEAPTVKDLFLILKECSPSKAHLAAKKLISHKNAQIRWFALEVFDPKTQEEMNAVFKIYRKEKNKGVKKKAATVLLKTNNPQMIDRLFRHAQGGFFRQQLLVELVELCGHSRTQESFPYLEKLFFKRRLFPSKQTDDLRASIMTSASRLQSPAALKLVKCGLKDKSKKVREASEIILKLGE